MTLYATGVRRAELTHLKSATVDSQRMVIHVQSGKGRKDRDVLLSPKLLEVLREHWRGLKRKPSAWLFPGNPLAYRRHAIDTKVVWYACKEAPKRAGLKKKVHPHTLQHRFATHLLERRGSAHHPDAASNLPAVCVPRVSEEFSANEPPR